MFFPGRLGVPWPLQILPQEDLVVLLCVLQGCLGLALGRPLPPQLQQQTYSTNGRFTLLPAVLLILPGTPLHHSFM